MDQFTPKQKGAKRQHRALVTVWQVEKGEGQDQVEKEEGQDREAETC